MFRSGTLQKAKPDHATHLIESEIKRQRFEWRDGSLGQVGDPVEPVRIQVPDDVNFGRFALLEYPTHRPEMVSE